MRLKQLQNATFEDITEVEDVIAGSGAATSGPGGLMPNVSTLQRRRISNTFNKFPNAKRKRTDDIELNEEFDVDEPDAIAGDDDDMVMFDPNESIIEGPDDDEDDL